MHEATTITILGIPFGLTVILTMSFSVIITFCLSYFLVSGFKVRPTSKRQVIFEHMMGIVDGIISGIMHSKIRRTYIPLIFTLFLFLIISNVMGLPFTIKYGTTTLWQSPTALIQVTMSLSLMVTLMAWYYGVKHNGIKGVGKSFISPMPGLLPMNIIEEFTSFSSLGIRIFGNILVGEVILHMLSQMAYLGVGLTTIFSFSAAALIGLVWVGFSIFIGVIQAYVFVMLTTLYISKKTEGR